MEPNKIYYDHTLISDKHFFGGYLNLAQNNIDIVFEVYKERFNVKGTTEQLIENSFADKFADIDFQNRRNFLARYFPVINYLPKDTRTDFRKKLLYLVNSINTLRNFYVHHYHEEISLDENLYKLLDTLFLEIVKEVRDNRLKTDTTQHLLKEKLNKEFSILCKHKKAKLEEDKKNGKRVSLDEKSIRNSVLNDAFRHLIYKDKNAKDKDKKKNDKDNNGNEHVSRYYKSNIENTSTAENKIPISQTGLLFLMSMFLSKKENEDMRARIKGFKAKLINPELPDFPNANSNNIKFMATHWVFSYLSYRGLKHQLSSNFDKETLLIQIVDELSKVPDAVYKALPKEKQESFIEDLNEYIKEGNEIDSLQESIVVHPVIRKRYENKFYYFALRYLDEFANFPSLRFHIYMGNYVHDRRAKHIAGTKYETDRIVKEQITVFARLSDAVKYKNEYFKNQNKEENVNVGWEIFPNPSYNIEENNIMIYLKVDSELKDEIKKYRDKRNSLEGRTKRQNNKDSKYNIVGKIANKSILNTDEPIAKLSLNELPALLYALLVDKKSAESIEDLLRDKIKAQFDGIKNYSSQTTLSISQIPKKLKRASDQVCFNTKKLLRDVDIELRNTDEKLALIAKNRKELNKRKNGRPVRKFVFTLREIGHEATWLAYDLVRFMPLEYRKEWKGYQHRQLQQSLAFWNMRQMEAYNMLKEVWNFNAGTNLWCDDIQGVFKSSKTFDSLLEKYLKIRRETFERISDCINNAAKDKHLKKAFDQQGVWNLFDKRIYVTDTTQAQIEKLLGKPLALPRGLFDDEPTFIKGVNIHDKPDSFAKWYRYANNPDHQFQEFYKYERDYTQLFEEDRQKKTPKASFDKLKIEHDLYIKKIKTQDLFLKLIAEDLFEKVFEHKINFNLPDFFMSQVKRIEKNKKAILQSRRKEGDQSENIINDSFIWSMTVPYPYTNQKIKEPIIKIEDSNKKTKELAINIKEPAIKIKDIGKFKRLLIDEKIKCLVQYEPKRNWTKLELENELTSYENIRRENILKIIQELEHNILERHSFNGVDHIPEFEQKGKPNFKHYIANGLVKDKYGDSDDSIIGWLLSQEEKTFEKDNTLSDLSTKPIHIQQAFLLIYIRNKILHNQLLTNSLYHHLLSLCGAQRQEKETYSEVICRCTLNLIVDLKS